MIPLLCRTALSHRRTILFLRRTILRCDKTILLADRTILSRNRMIPLPRKTILRRNKTTLSDDKPSLSSHKTTLQSPKTPPPSVNPTESTHPPLTAPSRLHTRQYHPRRSAGRNHHRLPQRSRRRPTLRARERADAVGRLDRGIGKGRSRASGAGSFSRR